MDQNSSRNQNNFTNLKFNFKIDYFSSILWIEFNLEYYSIINQDSTHLDKTFLFLFFCKLNQNFSGQPKKQKPFNPIRKHWLTINGIQWQTANENLNDHKIDMRSYLDNESNRWGLVVFVVQWKRKHKPNRRKENDRNVKQIQLVGWPSLKPAFPKFTWRNLKYILPMILEGEF